MRIGFSYVGLIYLIMLMAPNILWTKHKPAGYEKSVLNDTFDKNVTLDRFVNLSSVDNL